MKSSFTLLEIILSIIISSIIIVYTLGFAKEIFLDNKTSQEIEIKKVDLLFAKAFLQKNSQNLKENLEYKNKTLYFKNSTLLEEVEKFELKIQNDEVSILINTNNQIEQIWNFKL